MNARTATAANMDGFTKPAFEKVRETFARNFAERGEVGAAVAVYLDGEPVVDLWGGETLKKAESSGPWQRDTLVRMMSVNKGVTAICAHMLADRGLLDFDRAVAFYWPEFAQAGKDKITVGQLVSGMAAMVFPDAVPTGAAFDWNAMVKGLAEQAPIWEPGTRGAYHSSTYGHLVGEVIHRITGKLPGVFFREEIGEPLGIDYWFSVPAAHHHRVSDIKPNPLSVTGSAIAAGGDSPLGRAWRVLPTTSIYGANDPLNLNNEMPSGYGRGNARAIGKLFAALSVGGTLDGVKIMSQASIDRMRTLQWDGICGLTGRHFRYAMGLFLSTPEFAYMGPNPDIFGHPGAGGSVGFVDPARRMSFSYCTNYMCAGAGLGDRCEALIEAAFTSLE
ncbi:MAG: beta-lactamase family protein [Rhizobiaceae bacterium]|nr:beta-lactamase family protein [Rhizobiaceae bacterium]